MHKPPSPKFERGQKVAVKSDGRTGVVEDYWRLSGRASGYKFLIRFPDGKTQYFTTLELSR